MKATDEQMRKFLAERKDRPAQEDMDRRWVEDHPTIPHLYRCKFCRVLFGSARPKHRKDCRVVLRPFKCPNCGEPSNSVAGRLCSECWLLAVEGFGYKAANGSFEIEPYRPAAAEVFEMRRKK